MLAFTVILLLLTASPDGASSNTFRMYKQYSRSVDTRSDYGRALDSSQFSTTQSPCPDVFQYKSENGDLIGTVRVDKTSPVKGVQLDIELSVGNTVQGYNGKIILAEEREKVKNDILNRKPVFYKVLFPVWQNFPPRVTMILVNGELICSGPKIPVQMVPVLTTINLQHKLSVTTLSDPSQDSPPTNVAPTNNEQVNGNNPFPPRTPSVVVSRPSTTETPTGVATSNGNINEICGRPLATNSLIVNGLTVPAGAYPWLVALVRQLQTSVFQLSYICSGSLISERHVVTAAHCVKFDNRRLRPNELLCVFGKLNIRRWVNSGPWEKLLEPDTITVHPDYVTGKANADIALMTFQESIPFSHMVRPVCLWRESTDLAEVVAKIGTVVGWGKDENGESTAEPRQVNMPIVDSFQCVKTGSITAQQTLISIVSENTFCAGFRNGSGPCNGDSGSGFLLKKNGVFYLRGIVSTAVSDATSKTCNLNEYVVFTDTSKHLKWILKTMGQG